MGRMKHSRLHEHHLKRGAVLGEAGGWEMPVHYGDPVAEHIAVRQGVGIADLSHRGRIRVTGEDRVKWLQSVISNDILPLAAGQGLYSSFITHKGKMLSYFRVYALPDSLMLEDVGEIGDTTFQALRKFLLYGTKAKMENCAETWGLLLVSGPKAAELIKAAFGADINGLKSLEFLMQEIGGQQALLIRTEETGETDIEILLPADQLVTAWDRLWSAGEPMGLKPFGTEAREALRLEAGFPLRDFTTPGTALTVEVEGRRYDATVRPLPFYAPHSAASQNKTAKPRPAAGSPGQDDSLRSRRSQSVVLVILSSSKESASVSIAFFRLTWSCISFLLRCSSGSSLMRPLA